MRFLPNGERLLPQPNGWAHPTSHRFKRLPHVLGQDGDGVQRPPQVVIVLRVHPFEDAQVLEIGQIVEDDKLLLRRQGTLRARKATAPDGQCPKRDQSPCHN